MKNRISIAAFVLALLSIVTALAQTDSQRIIQEIIQDYDSLRYVDGEAKATTALKDHARFSPKQLVTLHTYLGFIEFALGKIDSAKVQFAAVLSLEPELRMDPVYTSPKIIALFEEVKRSQVSKINSGSVSAPKEIRYVMVEDRRSGAALRSLLLPGWGQLYKGQKTKGTMLLTAAGISAIGFVTLHIAQSQAHDDYRAAKTATEIDSKYADYNRLFKARNTAALACATLWLYSYIDAALTQPREAMPSRHSFGFAPEIGFGSLSLGIDLHF